MLCSDWCVVCALSRYKGGRGSWRWGRDSQRPGSTTYIFHLPAAVFITCSLSCCCIFCCVAHPLAAAVQRWRWHHWPQWKVCLPGFLVAFRKTTEACCAEWMALAGLPWREYGARDRMLIPAETVQPSVPIWVLLLVHDGKEKHPSLPFLSPVKSTLTWIQI